MSEWMAIAQWQDCAKMAKPGIIFEIRNAEGQSLLTPCVGLLPAKPFDWKSAAIKFRAIPQPKPKHSSPMPAPKR